MISRQIGGVKYIHLVSPCALLHNILMIQGQMILLACWIHHSWVVLLGIEIWNLIAMTEQDRHFELNHPMEARE